MGIPHHAKKSGHQLAREVLEIAASIIAPGITTDEIDKVVFEEAIKRDCYPSPLGYHGYPKSVCTSVNEVICHGIPDQRPLQDGDLINLGMCCISIVSYDFLTVSKMSLCIIADSTATSMPRTR